MTSGQYPSTGSASDSDVIVLIFYTSEFKVIKGETFSWHFSMQRDVKEAVLGFHFGKSLNN